MIMSVFSSLIKFKNYFIKSSRKNKYEGKILFATQNLIHGLLRQTHTSL